MFVLTSEMNVDEEPEPTPQPTPRPEIVQPPQVAETEANLNPVALLAPATHKDIEKAPTIDLLPFETDVTRASKVGSNVVVTAPKEVIDKIESSIAAGGNKVHIVEDALDDLSDDEDIIDELLDKKPKEEEIQPRKHRVREICNQIKSHILEIRQEWSEGRRRRWTLTMTATRMAHYAPVLTVGDLEAFKFCDKHQLLTTFQVFCWNLLKLRNNIEHPPHIYWEVNTFNFDKEFY